MYFHNLIWILLLSSMFVLNAVEEPVMIAGGDYLLNGLYDLKIFSTMPTQNDSAKDSPLQVRLPGEWSNLIGQHESFFDRKQNKLSKITLPPGCEKNAAFYGLYEKKFNVPVAWQGKHIILNLAGCQFRAIAYLNGVRLGEQTVYEKRNYDISSVLHYGAANTLKIALQPFWERPRAFGSPGVDRVFVHGGIVHDLSFSILDNPLMLHWRYLHTDLKKGTATFRMRATNYSKETLRNVNAELTLHSSPAVKIPHKNISIPPGDSFFDMVLPLDGAYSGEKSAKNNIELWDVDSPKLYDVELVCRKDSRVVATLSKSKTGFREIKIAGSKVLLNGVARSFFGESGSRLNLLMTQCQGAYPGQIIGCMKSLGLNFVNLLEFPTHTAVADVADEIGFFLSPVMKYDADYIYAKYAAFPGLTRPERAIPPEDMELHRRRFADLAEVYALHPSIIGYARMFNWLCESVKAYNPHLAGLRENDTRERTVFAEDELKRTSEIDPTRLNYLHHGGGKGSIYTHNRYWSCGIPVEEKADFPALWSKAVKNKMPFFVTEGNLFPSWPSLYPKWGVSNRNPAYRGMARPYAVREIAALGIGAEAYFGKADFKSIREDHKRSLLHEIGGLRHYGVAGHMMHTDIYQAYKPGRLVNSPHSPADNVPGFVADNPLWTGQHPSSEINDLGRVMRHAFSPTTLFWAGSDDAPTTFYGNYFSGEKMPILLKVYHETAKFAKGELLVTLANNSDGRVLWSATKSMNLTPGMRQVISFAANLPEVQKTTVLTLSAILKFNSTDDERQITRTIVLFPQFSAEKYAGKSVAIHDRYQSLAKLTEMFLTGSPKKLTEMSNLDGIKLILIGQNALDADLGNMVKRLDISKFLNNGGNMIIFEQTESKILGLPADFRRARAVFAAVPDQRFWRDMPNSALYNWRGKSAAVKPFPAAGSGFHWSEPIVTSANGIVSAWVPEKPHRGNFIALAESGYDLQFAPLIEFHEGRGRVWLCQMNVLGALTEDPAALRITGSLLQSALAERSELPGERGILFAGDDSAKKAIGALGRSVKEYAARGQTSSGLLILGKNAQKSITAAQVREFAEKGGTVLLLPGVDCVALLPGVMENVPFYDNKAYTSLGDAAVRKLKVSLSDLYWRDKLKLTGMRPCANHKASAVLGDIALGKGRVVYCAVPWSLPEKSVFRVKSSRLWSSLLTSLGAYDRAVNMADVLARSGTSLNIPLGNSAWFRLDPQNHGAKEKWQILNGKLDESSWKRIVVPGAWEKTPYLENYGPVNPPAAAPDYDGVAYYRFAVMVPKSAKDKECILNLGVVDDHDTVYVNGKRIGGTGAAFAMPYSISRSYRIPARLIRYGDINDIVVRVEDVAGEGGIMHGKLQLEFTQSSIGREENLMMVDGESVLEVLGTSPYYNEQW